MRLVWVSFLLLIKEMFSLQDLATTFPILPFVLKLMQSILLLDSVLIEFGTLNESIVIAQEFCN